MSVIGELFSSIVAVKDCQPLTTRGGAQVNVLSVTWTRKSEGSWTDR